MKELFDDFFNRSFNSKFIYSLEDGEIYRFLRQSNMPMDEFIDEAIVSQNFVIVGEALLNDYTYFEQDDCDKFLMDTFNFYNKGIHEYNKTVKELASNKFCRQMFDTVIANTSLIEKIQFSKRAFELESPTTSFSNRFLLKDDFIKPIVLPTLKIKSSFGSDYLEFDVDSFHKSEMLIRNVNEIYRERFFKPVINKTIDKMTVEEKSVITMYYQS